MDESREWEYIKERSDLFAEIKVLKETVNRYEKALKEIAEFGGTDMIGKTCAKVSQEALR